MYVFDVRQLCAADCKKAVHACCAMIPIVDRTKSIVMAEALMWLPFSLRQLLKLSATQENFTIGEIQCLQETMPITIGEKSTFISSVSSALADLAAKKRGPYIPLVLQKGRADVNKTDSTSSS